MDFVFNRNTLLQLTDMEILELLDDITKFDLYAISSAWRETPGFILKCKGAKGDVIVDWK